MQPTGSTRRHQFVNLFLDEARLAAQLGHPNVVSVYDAGQERDEYFFIMEYVHGGDLRALINAAVGSSSGVSCGWPSWPRGSSNIQGDRRRTVSPSGPSFFSAIASAR